ncbi:MAG TPA: GrpB family protein [Ktedonobacterales bacterium]|nr:GrpB family protein [Ktedonobacterales bacterium]
MSNPPDDPDAPIGFPAGATGVPAPNTEERMLAVHLTPPQPLNGPISIAEYDPAWPQLYEVEAAKIRAALGERILLLEHVGSTSVPGLAAKPLIDIALVVADTTDEAAYVPALEAQGYMLHIREPDWHQHRLLKGANPTVNLHVFNPGCDEVRRMLRMRDWLRANPADRALYEQTKRELARRTWKYTQNYADAKSEVVEAILARAFAAETQPE